MRLDGLVTSPSIRVIRRPRRGGSGAARKTGIAEAKGEWIAWIDGDGTYPAEDLARLWEARPDYDQVIGARPCDHGPLRWLRLSVKRLACLWAERRWKRAIPDLNSGTSSHPKECRQLLGRSTARRLFVYHDRNTGRARPPTTPCLRFHSLLCPRAGSQEQVSTDSRHAPIFSRLFINGNRRAPHDRIFVENGCRRSSTNPTENSKVIQLRGERLIHRPARSDSRSMRAYFLL